MNRRVILERPGGETLAFDCWVSGTFGGSATVIDHRIEQGATISDHSEPDPRQITLEVRQTETPLGDDGGPFGEERIQEAMRFLEEAGRGGEPLVAMIPRVGDFENMLLVRWPNEISIQRSTTFEIVIKQIEEARALIVRVPVEAIAPPSRAGQQEEEDIGAQPLSEIEGEMISAAEVPPSLGVQLRDKAADYDLASLPIIGGLFD